jgi:serine protease Do
MNRPSFATFQTLLAGLRCAGCVAIAVVPLQRSWAAEPASPAQSQTATRSTKNDLGVWTVPPRPAPGNRKELPAVFSKPAPASLADLKALEQRVRELVSKVSPAVVAVEIGHGSGSGVLITADGLVLTAGHVCGAPGREVVFRFPDGSRARGKSLGSDEETDTGLLRITDRGPWPHAELGDLDDVRAGDWVLALGHPGGYDSTRSLVVRLGRIIRLGADALQTDCTISPGDSGGPLFDMNGRVIGIHTAIRSSLTENFHVPISEFYEGWDTLVQTGARTEPTFPSKAFLGATFVDAVTGSRITGVDADSPAARAGLKTGDIVLRVDGRELRSAVLFRRFIAESEPGEALKLEIKRGERQLSLTVRLDSAPRLK